MDKSGSCSEKIVATESDLERLPKTRFEQIDIDRETELFYTFMKSGRWAAAFDKVYPGLRDIQKGSKDREECMLRYREFVEGIHARDREQMLAALEQIHVEWEKIGPAFLDELSKHFETEWPEDRDEVVGYVSVLPVYPRFLRDYSFCVGYKNVTDMVETAAHEILHFLWFKKWKEVFPATNEKEYESPHLTWRLSEIMDPIILQCHPKIRELIKPQHWGYSSFQGIKIDDVSMTEYFKGIYMQSIAAGDDFETTLEKLWEEAKEHETEISGF